MVREFNEMMEAKSRAVCAAMAERADEGRRAPTERERLILGMWPKFEDGEYVTYEDEFQLDGEAHTAYGFNFGANGRVSIASDRGSHVRLPVGARVKRPGQGPLDGDDAEVAG